MRKAILFISIALIFSCSEKGSLDEKNRADAVENQEATYDNLIDNTSDDSTRKFGVFIYGPKTTFISVTPNSNWVQIPNDGEGSNSGMVITSRGSYGYIKNTIGNSVDDKITNLILIGLHMKSWRKYVIIMLFKQ